MLETRKGEAVEWVVGELAGERGERVPLVLAFAPLRSSRWFGDNEPERPVVGVLLA
jgi:hypothetical protein